MHEAGDIRAQRHQEQRHRDDISKSIFDQRLCTGSLFCLFGLSVFSEAKAPKQAAQEHCGFEFLCLSKAQEHPRPFRVSLVSLTPKERSVTTSRGTETTFRKAFLISAFVQDLCFACLVFSCFQKPRHPSKPPKSTAVSSFCCLSKAQEHQRPFRVSLVSLTPKSTAFSSFFGFSETQEHRLFEFLWFFWCQVAQVQQEHSPLEFLCCL